MLNKKNIILAIITSVISLGGFHLINSYLKLQDDNPVEELSEELIYHSLMINLDLTPFTPEKHD
jgi:hypothetical protein